MFAALLVMQGSRLRLHSEDLCQRSYAHPRLWFAKSDKSELLLGKGRRSEYIVTEVAVDEESKAVGHSEPVADHRERGGEEVRTNNDVIISAHHNVRLRLIADGGQVDAECRFAIGGDFADQVNTLGNSNLAKSTGGGDEAAERQFTNRWQVVDARTRHFTIDVDDANITLNMDLVAGTDQNVLRQIALLQLLPVNDDDASLAAVGETEIHRLLQCATV